MDQSRSQPGTPGSARAFVAGSSSMGSRNASQLDISGAGANAVEGETEAPREPEAEATAPASASVATDPGGRDRTVSQTEPKGERHLGSDAGQEPAEKPQTREARGKSRALLPDKPQDFQIRVKVIEGRGLVGANISPVVRVSMCNQTRQTQVKDSTNKPYYDETFFINVNMSPPVLFDESITFEVFNSRRLRSNALLGSFNSDIGFFYDEPSHAVIRKWLLLTDPDDKMAGIKGYLKVTIIVLGQGDEAPSSSEDVTDDTDDIESNLLQPSGVELRPATFSLKVFRAEDIPQMDPAFFENVKSLFGAGGSEPKELVDPYLQFSFAGKKVKSRIHEKNDHPEFNEELNLGFKFPSMCEKIKLQLFDWDQLSADDCIGTISLPLAKISGYGDEGFLPVFGPTFVNMYGSTREYSDLPDEFDELNLGIGEGVTYRGRVLVELETKLGELPDEESDDLPSDEIIRIQPFLRRRKYKLFACFMEATMIATTDDQIMFEVSIGNYGNSLDKSVPPSSATTNPTNAVFDGCYYYYLPWSDSKPCVSVDSHWEDIAFRLEPLNILTRMCERLEDNIEKVELSIEANASDAETALVLISCLDQLITDCKKPLPTFDDRQLGVNSLDFKIQERRLREKKAIMSEAIVLRDSATDAKEALEEIKGFHHRLRNLAEEPQNSMPDVEVWMLSGSKRIAYYRVPAADVLYSPNEDACGKDNGNILDILLKYPGKKGQDMEDFPEVPAQVRMMIWLGLEKHQEAWNDRSETEGDFCVYAETYENQINVLGKWTRKGMQRPAWSNLSGDLRLTKDVFVCPAGWRWEGEFFVNPELGMQFDTDSGHKNFVEDVFDNELRVPGGSFGASPTQWTDMHGSGTTARDDIQVPTGWQWTSDWLVDTNRAVDENGWEYSVEPTLEVSYGPVEKTYHLCRRRRWVRSRKLVNEEEEEAKEKELAAEGWEYAPMFSMKFHLKERKTDLVRRRRWHRKMMQDDPNAPAVFRMEEQKGKEATLNAPRMFITFDNPHKFQLRVYIYQARDLRPSDPDGFSDPYARVAIVNQSQVTEVKFKTLCPTWDQTLIFDNVMIYGSVELTALNPPNIVIELFDKDLVGKDEFMGRCMVEPEMKMNGQEPPSPRLLWYNLMYGDQEAGEILAAFELFLDEGADLPYPPPTRNNLYIVPDGIRPVMQRTAIEVLCWGVRNMKKFQLANVSSPSVELECGDHVVQSSVIKNTKKNPNFDQPLYFFDIYLPKEELYTPPLNIKVRDNRSFGRRPIVGLHSVKSLQPFRCLAPGSTKSDELDDTEDTRSLSHSSMHTIEIREEEETKKETLEDDIDWWSKFYASIGEEHKCGEYLIKGYDKLLVYKTELEKVEPFTGFQDFVETFPIHRGKVKGNEQPTTVGEYKGTFRVYPLPGDPNVPIPPRVIRNYPPNDPTECVIRVYIIRALDLQPQDENGLADPYIKIQLGKNKINDREHYIPNQLNPIFGRMFEMTAILPIEKDLKILVYDYDLISRDDIVGETTIDLENRFLTRYRATCGLPQTYCTSGINKWRDSKTPKEILAQFCESRQMAKPQFLSNSQIVMESTIYDLQEFEEGVIRHSHLGPPDQRLALYVLNSLPLVPEHVETRPLYNSLQPGIEQGKIQLWVDIFPKFLGEPGPPFNITARQPNSYELRVIIWNTSDVIADEVSITGEEMSDIYVKGWLAGVDKKQKTDVHYRSLDGEGNFNWRFIFPLLYLPAERVMVVRKKAHFWSLDETEERLPPTLIIQLWDNDLFSPDDFLGTLELNLNRMPKPAKRAKNCGLQQIPQMSKGKSQKAVETVSVFEMKSVYGWWPAIATDDGENTLAGKVEMTIELLTKEEAEVKPAGKARDEPNQNPTLDPPNRPATSFLWFTSPLTTLRLIIWKRYKWYIIGTFVILLLTVLLILFVYSTPGYIVKKIIGA